MAETLHVDLESIPTDPSTRLMDKGLCRDDLDVVELAMAVEEHFGLGMHPIFKLAPAIPDINDPDRQYSQLQ